MLTKTGIRCPITAIDCVKHKDVTILFWANGGNLHVDVLQSVSDGFASEFTIFNNHNIRGIKSCETLAKSVVFGDKSFAVVSWADFETTKKLTTNTVQRDLNDLILDCKILGEDTDNLFVVVGYAHNFLDLFHISANSSVSKVWRVQCPDAGTLFSMSIHKRKNEILIASGTVFGKIIVWKVVEDDDKKTPRARVLQIVHRHEGVVFRIIWSHCATKMLTVSDDRTARLWDVTYVPTIDGDLIEIESVSERFVAWGHVSRVWDAAFLNHPSNGDDAQEIATCSEDGTVKFWRCDLADVNGGGCVATLRGHSSDVWRLATAFDNKVVISCGNDAAVKLWDVAFHKIASPEQTSSGCRVMRFPALPTEDDGQATAGLKNHNHNCRRANGVCFVKISPSGSLAVVVMIDGTVWQVKLAVGDVVVVGDELWTVAARLNKAITSADVEFTAEFTDGPISHMRIAVAHVDGTNCYLNRALNGDGCDNLDSFSSFDKFEWKAHDLRTVNLWFSGAYLITASLKGVCSLWTFGSVGGSQVLRKTFDVITGKGEIATSACHVHAKRPFFVLGDSRGGVSVFDLSDLPVASLLDSSSVLCSTAIVIESRFFPRVHGSDPVSCIAQCDNGFVTAGHDGHVAIFKTLVNSSRVLDWEVVNRMQSLPVTTPDRLVVVEGDKGMNSLLVGGYFGHLYIVWDLLRSIQLLRIEGGGWKRPHHCLLNFLSTSGRSASNTLPEVIFVCPAPIEKGQTVLQVFGAQPTSILSDVTTSSLPLQMRSSTLGRVCYCNVLLQGTYKLPNDGELVEGERYLVVGGEEGRVKVFNATDLSPRQELVLPSNASLKALSCCSSGEDLSRGIVVGGGSKLVYSVWIYDYQSIADDGQPLQQVLSIGCEGKLWPRATQDHRVLSVQCTFLSHTQDEHGTTSYCYLIVFCDSRGLSTVARFTHSRSDGSSCCSCSFEALQELQVAHCPVISSCVMSLRSSESGNCQYILCCFGDTSGTNRLYLLALSRLVGGLTLQSSRLLCEYSAHTMGSNAIAMQVTSSTKHGNGDVEWRLVVCSGGDDQSLCSTSWALSVSDRKMGTLQVTLFGLRRDLAASGSAIKGVQLMMSDEQSHSLIHVAAVGYDQRLSLWRLSGFESSDKPTVGSVQVEGLGDSTPASLGQDSVKMFSISDNGDYNERERQMVEQAGDKLLSVEWVAGDMVNVSDVCSLNIVKDLVLTLSTCKVQATAMVSFTCAVAGEGFQLLKFCT